jgi:hypothetical protein
VVAPAARKAASAKPCTGEVECEDRPAGAERCDERVDTVAGDLEHIHALALEAVESGRCRRRRTRSDPRGGRGWRGRPFVPFAGDERAVEIDVEGVDRLRQARLVDLKRMKQPS